MECGESKRLLGTPRRRWEDNIKLHLQDVGCDGLDWIDLFHDRDRRWVHVKARMYFRVQYNEGAYLDYLRKDYAPLS